jgi:hypothetical protein
MTWVSKPIDAAFFVAEIAASHQVSGTRPVAVVALSADGDVLLRNDLTSIPWSHLVKTAR